MLTVRAWLWAATLIFVAQPVSATEPDVIAIKATARTVVEHLTAGEFAKAAEAFDASAAMTVDKLRSDWQAAVKDAGLVLGLAVVDAIVRGTGVIVRVRCTFAKTTRDVTLFCTAAGKVNRFVVLAPPLGGPGLLRAVMAEVFQADTPGGEGTVT